MCGILPGQRLAPDGKSVIHPTLAEANAEVARIIAEEDAARAAVTLGVTLIDLDPK